MKHSIHSLFRRGLALLMILSILSLPVLAAGDTVYTINWAGIQVSLPTDYIIVASDDASGADSNDISTSEEVYLYGDWTDAQGEMDFTIQIYDLGDTGVEFSTCSQEELDAEFAVLDGFFRENFTVTQSVIQNMGPTRFCRFVYSSADGRYFVGYVTGHYGEYTLFEAVGYKGYVSQEALTILDNMVSSIVLTDGAVSTEAATGGLAPVKPEESSGGLAVIESPEQVYVEGIAPDENAPMNPVIQVTDDTSASAEGDHSEDSKSGGIGFKGIMGIGAGILVVLWVIGSSGSKKEKKKLDETLKNADRAKAAADKARQASAPSFTSARPSSTASFGSAPKASSGGFCTACGSQLKPGAAFCGKCGKKVD